MERKALFFLLLLGGHTFRSPMYRIFGCKEEKLFLKMCVKMKTFPQNVGEKGKRFLNMGANGKTFS